jgi:hypothetical protein
VWPTQDPTKTTETCEAPVCCSVVPILYIGTFSTGSAECVASRLRTEGSSAAPGFMEPEGIVVYHRAARWMAKLTLDNDGRPKTLCVKS